jgi:diacylglycerol kinase (ATP)
LITAFGAAVLGYIILFPYLKSFFAEGFIIARHSDEEIALMAFILVMILVIITKSHFGKGHPLQGGMPSGHSALAFSVWVSITYLTAGLRSPCFASSCGCLDGSSRITFEAHNP